MTESEVRQKLKELKGTLLHLEMDSKTGKVKHAEIHSDDGLLWKFPPKSRAKIKSQPWKKYGSDFWRFSLQRPDYQMMAMERMEV
jgi:hypothetical protein